MNTDMCLVHDTALVATYKNHTTLVEGRLDLTPIAAGLKCNYISFKLNQPQIFPKYTTSALMMTKAFSQKIQSFPIQFGNRQPSFPNKFNQEQTEKLLKEW